MSRNKKRRYGQKKKNGARAPRPAECRPAAQCSKKEVRRPDWKHRLARRLEKLEKYYFRRRSREELKRQSAVRTSYAWLIVMPIMAAVSAGAGADDLYKGITGAIFVAAVVWNIVKHAVYARKGHYKKTALAMYILQPCAALASLGILYR